MKQKVTNETTGKITMKVVICCLRLLSCVHQGCLLESVSSGIKAYFRPKCMFWDFQLKSLVQQNSTAHVEKLDQLLCLRPV